MNTTEPAKLLVLTSTLPRWQGDADPRFVEYLSYELAKKYDVFILAPHFPGAARRETLSNDEQKLSIYRYRYFLPALESLANEGGIMARIRQNPLRLLLVPFFLVAQFFAVARLHRQQKFDAIHAHWIIPQGLVAAVFRLISRNAPPVLMTSHGSDLFALRGSMMVRLKRWIMSKAGKITVVSAAMREHCVSEGYDAAKITVAPMGVALQSTFTPGAEKGGRDGLIFVGNLVEIKGLAFLIEAMAILTARYPELLLTVVGDGPDGQTLLEHAERLQLRNNVQFLGSVPNTQLPDLLRGASVAVMPSLREGLGLVAIEAMGCGCAVVASDLPAIRDTVLPGKTGLVARPGDAKDLAEKIDQLLADDDLRRALAENGRRHAVKNFDWQTVGDDYVQLVAGMIRTSKT
jgi:glycosyltransferase involved in cell wall biosynthesis